jgi:5-methylcytosine-specific restriction endonuclease McrA
MNKWGIPAWLEADVRRRDRECIYCHVPFLHFPVSIGSRKGVATWEHIVNDASIVTRENIARCCGSCNSSKGTKILSDWLDSSYCKQRGITKGSIAEVAQQALK